MPVGNVELKVVVFRVGREEYAVPIGVVREVIPWIAPTPVPDAPAMVEGVVNLRGEIIPVVDLARLFRTHRSREGEAARILVLEVETRQAGFVVDEVTEVHPVLPEAVSPPSPLLRQGGGQALTPLIVNILKLGENRLVVQVDPLRILAGTDVTIGV